MRALARFRQLNFALPLLATAVLLANAMLLVSAAVLLTNAAVSYFTSTTTHGY
jgi:hypothetical protein